MVCCDGKLHITHFIQIHTVLMFTNKLLITSTSLALGLASLSHAAQTIFQDNFDTSLASGVNTDVNFELGGGRQSGGTTTSTYTEQTVSGAGGFINVNGSFTGDNLLLRNNYNSTGARASGVVLDTNFASILEGKRYQISFDASMSIGAGAATDRWMSFYIMGAQPGDINAATVNAGASDFGILLRDDGRANIWDDGAVDTNLSAGTTGVTLGSVYSVLIDVDETLATPTVSLSIDSSLIGTYDIDFEAGDAGLRYFGLRAQIGTAGGTTNGALFDSRYDNLAITLIPEPSSSAILAGLLAYCAIAVRRRK